MRVERLLGEGSITNSYLVFCEASREGIIIDPNFNDEEGVIVLAKIRDHRVQIQFIVITHGHPDHVSGNRFLKETLHLPILVHENDSDGIEAPWDMLRAIAEHSRECPDCGKTAKRTLEISKDGKKALMGCRFCGPKIHVEASPPADQLIFDGESIQVGDVSFQVLHTPGHTSGSVSLYNKQEGVVFTGDTLQAGAIGGTRSPSSSEEQLVKSLKLLLTFPDDTVVDPGH